MPIIKERIRSVETIHNNKWLSARLIGIYHEYDSDNMNLNFIPGNVMHNAFLFRCLRSDGDSIKSIAENCNCSVGLVHRYVSDMDINSHFVSQDEIDRMRGLFQQGYSRKSIVKMCNRSINIVIKYTRDMGIIKTGKKISEEKKEIIKNMRYRGDTLGAIASVVGVCQTTVYNYTQELVNDCRMDRFVLVNTKTGDIAGYVNK